MTILSIETSCDETAAAIVAKNQNENSVKILSNIIASSLTLHSKTGGIIPDIAAREQLKYIIPVIEKAIEESQIKPENLDAIAVTYGPGLIGSLLVGVETAKTLSYLWKKPIIPVNHLLGHIYANWLVTPNEKQLTDNKKLGVSSQQLEVEFPALALLVSGGHTDLVLMKSHNNFKWLGGTLDDAAGEAFDKIGRLLDLPYPAGPAMEKLAEHGNINRFIFPRPMIGSKDFNFSFSGLKAALAREVKKTKLDEQTKADICTAVQKSIVGVLARKTIKAAEKYNVKSLLLGGGVASNEMLRKTLEIGCQELGINFFVPEKKYCTDNAAMIGAYALFRPEPKTWKEVSAHPELYFS